jgi:Flp pilus assembly protein TadD
MPEMSEVNARLGMALEMDALCDTSNAIDQLRTIIAQKPAVPYAAMARAQHQLGVAFDRSGRRSEAVVAYQHALAATPNDDRLRLREKIRASLKRAPIARSCR